MFVYLEIKNGNVQKVQLSRSACWDMLLFVHFDLIHVRVVKHVSEKKNNPEPNLNILTVCIILKRNIAQKILGLKKLA